jgi:GABA(A) receptor-associated protein
MNEWLQKSLEDRQQISAQIMTKHENHIPVLIEFGLDMKKIIINRDHTICALLQKLREQIKLSSKEALFLFVICGNSNRLEIPVMNLSVDRVYNMHKSEDGFLYCRVVKENTFGCTPILGWFEDLAESYFEMRYKLHLWWNRDLYKDLSRDPLVDKKR